MDFRKLSQSGQPAASTDEGQKGACVTGIVKVKQDGYEPAKLKVRSKMSSRIFTAEFSAEDLAEIENDPKVEAVSVSEKIPLQKSP